MKKAAITLLSIFMLITVTSCETANEPQTNTSASPTETSSPGNANDSLETIVYEIPNSGSDHLLTSLDKINARLEELGKKYRVEFRPIGLRENLSELAASGEVDIITADESEDARKMAKSGLLLEITDYLGSEKGRALYESITEDMWYSLSINGGIYGAAGYIYAGSTPPCYYVNKELMEKYDLTENDFHCSIAEMENVFEKVKKGEGDDFHPLEFNFRYNTSSTEYISKSVGINRETGEAELCIDNEDYMSVIRDVYDMYDKGYVLVRGGSGGQSDKENYLVSFLFTAYPLSEVEDTWRISDDDPRPEHTVDKQLLIIWDGYGWYTTRTWPVTCVCVSSKKQEQALDLITAIYTDKALSNLFIYGVEGIDYTVHDNGGIIKENHNPLATLWFGNYMVADSEYNESKEFYLEKHKKLLESPYHDFRPEEYLDAEIDASIELLGDGLLQGKSYDEAVAEIRAELEKGGAREYLDDLNEQLKEYMSGR